MHLAHATATANTTKRSAPLKAQPAIVFGHGRSLLASDRPV